MVHELNTPTSGSRQEHRGGRPTAAEARRRERHLLEVAAAMFMQKGFRGTSVEAVAEAAGTSKRTVYARYRDKSELFRAVLNVLIERWLAPLHRFEARDEALEPMLTEIGRHLLATALAPEAISVHRIIIAEAERQPEFARLAQAQGRQAAVRAIAAALERRRAELRIDDMTLAAELFVSLIVDSSVRLAALGMSAPRPGIEQRVRAAVDLFLNGARRC